MPVGAVDLASATLVTTSPEGGVTVVRSIDLRSGREWASTKIAGSWTLPLVVPGALPEGLAASTGQIVLTDSRPAAGTSRFAVLGRDLAAEPRVVTLNGQFGFDAVGPNGQYLFLIEALGGGHYQVRAYDMTLGRLNEGVIVDKREIGESMEGRPVSRGASDDGIWVQTVYVRGDGTAFVHQLETVNGIALCVDLPASARMTSGAAADAWRIAVTGPDGAFVANGGARFVARIASGDVAAASKLGVGNVLALEAGPDGAGDVAYLLEPTTLTVVDPSAHIVGHATSGEAADAAVSPDGSAIYLIGPGARLGRLRPSSGWPVPAGDLPLDPSVDWTGASLVGVLPR
jgi:hypothetical protein